jgi:hypothetical protein
LTPSVEAKATNSLPDDLVPTERLHSLALPQMRGLGVPLPGVAGGGGYQSRPPLNDDENGYVQ